MGAFTSIAAVGLSIEAVLDRRLDAAWTADPTAFRRHPRARLVHTEQFRRGTSGVAGPIDDGTVSIFCWRTDLNRTMGPPWAAVGAAEGRVHVPVDAHFLITAWESDAEAELRLMGFTLLALESMPVLTGPLLHPAGRWTGGESVQLVNEDLVTEDVLRTFEAMTSDFRLSVSYVARVIRLDGPAEPPAPDVVVADAWLRPSPVRPAPVTA